MYVQYIIFCVYQVNFVLFLIYMYIDKKNIDLAKCSLFAYV